MDFFNTFTIVWIIVVFLVIFLYIRHRRKTTKDPVVHRLLKKVKKRDLKRHLKYRKEKGYLNNDKFEK